ncbi:conserved hypothetical protein, partial [Ricinus communis]
MGHDQTLLLHRYNAIVLHRVRVPQVHLREQAAQAAQGLGAGDDPVVLLRQQTTQRRGQFGRQRRHRTAVGRQHIDHGAGRAQAVAHQFAAAFATHDQHAPALEGGQVQRLQQVFGIAGDIVRRADDAVTVGRDAVRGQRGAAALADHGQRDRLRPLRDMREGSIDGVGRHERRQRIVMQPRQRGLQRALIRQR